MKEEITFNPEEWNFKVTDRNRGRMKIQIKLSREEAEAFKNFTEMIKPPDADFETFVKSVFFMGIEYMNIKLSSAVKEYAEVHKEELTSSGVDVDRILNYEDPNIEIVE
jgi:hypothetical protein